MKGQLETAVVVIPRPAVLGGLAGVLVSLSLTFLDLLPASQGHAVLVAAIATPYIVFALLDGSAKSIAIEFAGTTAFVAAAFLVFASPAWVVALALLAHCVWDYAHHAAEITNHVGDYAVWCGTLDLSAAATLIVVSIL